MPRLFVVFAFVIVAGCTIDPEQASAPAPVSPPASITCQAGADCDAKWSRAIEWITKNSEWRIQRQTDALIQTSSSINDSPSPAFKVTKVAAGAPGAYEIDFSGKCSNMWGCMPTVAAARAKFAAFVQGSAPAQTTPALLTAAAPLTPASLRPAAPAPPTFASASAPPTSAQTPPEQAPSAQALPAQPLPAQTSPVQVPMAWFRKDQQQVNGNPALENQIQFDRVRCQASAGKNGPDFENAFTSCMDARGYTLEPPAQATQEAATQDPAQAIQDAH